MKVSIVTQSLTRPADTDAYTANDVIADNAGGTLKFTGLAYFNHGGGLIKSATLVSSQNAATKLDADLLLFSEDITDLDADNAAFTPTDAQLETLIGVIPFPTASGKAGDATSAAGGNAFTGVSNLNIAVPSVVYGVLVARNAYAPVSGEKITINLAVIKGYTG